MIEFRYNQIEVILTCSDEDELMLELYINFWNIVCYQDQGLILMDWWKTGNKNQLRISIFKLITYLISFLENFFNLLFTFQCSKMFQLSDKGYFQFV
jgi:hypothetical protein